MVGYVTGVLDDARVFANHAKKKVIDVEDVKLAIQMTTDRIFTAPPPRDILLDVARTKNSTPLPFVKPHCGLRLPPDRYCLSACNFRMKNFKKTPKQPIHQSNYGSSSSFMNANISSNISNGTSMKLQSKQQQQQQQQQQHHHQQQLQQQQQQQQQQHQNLSLVKRQNTLSTVARTQSITIPKPVIKFSSGTPNPMPKAIAKPKIQITSASPSTPSLLSPNSVKVETDDPSGSLKRKREDDDDYDMMD
ncbi:transcription initiation factor TFIID subunit 9 isoform X2 [Anabrus simplex]|uniref:transcription initiation factor TFIID subunit 9 isoform X2 n=1 Tax=Anabrus simplex TaxID=316456 RepID=UPI0034DCD2AC